MKIGISTASYYPLETELALEEIGKCNAKYTEIFFNAQCELKNSFIDILHDIKDHYGINVVSLHPTMSLAESFMIFSAYERRFQESLDNYSRYSEIAAELGAEYIIMHGGKPNGILTDEEYCEGYMQIKNATLKNGITVLQENVAYHRAGEVEFLTSMRDILKDDAEFCIDIKQAIRCGYDPFVLVKEFINNTRHYHISDHSTASDCLLPGNGKFNFDDFYNFLNANNYKGSCIIEVYNNSYKDYSEIKESYDKMIKNLTFSNN